MFVLLLTAHTVLLAVSGAVHSPAFDEVGHLPAGMIVWKERRFDLYRVNPPLVKSLAAVPAVAADARLGMQYSEDPSVRPEWEVGRNFISANGRRVWTLWTYGRWMCLPLSVLGAYLCFRWAAELFGPRAGLLAATVWCFCPNVIGNGSMITPDLGATTFGLLAAYTFARWLKAPTFGTAVFAGFALGLAQLSKMSWLVLFGLWPLLWTIDRLARLRADASTARCRAPTWQLVFILLIGWDVLNCGYLWQGTFKPLREYQFQSSVLSGRPADSHNRATGNRFADTWLESLPVPFPEDYVIGLDVQKLDFERKKWSYLFGEFKFGGWWYYYIVALVFKVPLGYWLIAGLAVWYAVWARRRRAVRGDPGEQAGEASAPGASGAGSPGSTPGARGLRAGIPLADALALSVPPIALFVLVSSETGFSRYIRYVLPCFPFAFIAMSRVAQVFDYKGLWPAKLLLVGGLAWGVGSSLWHYPHSLSYMHELAGGPKHGHRILNDANLSWGQDVFFLRDWIAKHPEARPLTVAYVSFFDMSVAGVDFPMTPSFDPARHYTEAELDKVGPQPGWHIVDIHYLRNHRRHYDYFHQFRPVDYVAYSMHVFHLTLDEANAAREKLGLPRLRGTDREGGGGTAAAHE